MNKFAGSHLASAADTPPREGLTRYVPSRFAVGTVVVLATLLVCLLGIRSELDRAKASPTRSDSRSDPPAESYRSPAEPRPF